MMTIVKAQELAKIYARNQGEIFPGIYYTVKDGEEYSDCFYFDYFIVDSDGNIPQEPPMIAGAPGVIVAKETGEVQVISWGRLSELRKTSR